MTMGGWGVGWGAGEGAYKWNLTLPKQGQPGYGGVGR